MTVFKFHLFHAHAELCSKFQIPASTTVGGVAETRTVLQCDMAKKYVYFMQKRPGPKFCFPYEHVQCINELCCKFQILASNTVKVAETRTVLQCDMVKIFVCLSRGHNYAIIT